MCHNFTFYMSFLGGSYSFFEGKKKLAHGLLGHAQNEHKYWQMASPLVSI